MIGDVETALAASPDAPPDAPIAIDLPGDQPEQPTVRSVRLTLVVTGLVVAAGRWWVTNDRRIFHVSPDEPSQLAVAKWLSGGGRWNMFDHATWQPGLATLITPLYWFTDDPETVARLALGVNAVIGGIAAMLLVVLTQRLTGLSIRTSSVLAILVGLAPSSLSASAFIWAEPLVTLTFLGAVLLLIRAYATDGAAVAVAAIACSVAGYTSHSRLLPMVGTTVVLTVGVAAWRRRWHRAAGLGACAAVLFALSALWSRFILANVWDDPAGQNTVSAVWKRSQQPLDVADSMLGQAWYQLTATLGIAGIGAWVVVRSCRSGERRDRIDAVAARLIVATTAPLLVVSAIFMADRPRSDQFIYGRYNDAVMWPVIVVGLAWLVTRARNGFERRHLILIATIGVLIGVTGLTVDRLHGDAIRESYGVRSMIAGLLAFVDDSDSLDVWRTTLIVLGLFVCAVGAIAVSRRVGRAGSGVLVVSVALFAALFVVAAHRTDDVLDLRLNGWRSSSPVREVDALVPPDAPLAVKTVNTSDDPAVSWTTQRQRYQVYQFYLPHRTFVRDRGLDDAVGPYVFAPLRDEKLVDGGAKLLWTDPSVQIGLWLEPTAD